LYSAIGYQLRQAQAGRDLLERATVARSVLGRLHEDVMATASLSDPARFRRQQQQSSASGSGGASGAGSAAGASGGAGSGSGSGSTVPAGVAVTLPLGVMGDSSSLHLFISKVP